MKKVISSIEVPGSFSLSKKNWVGVVVLKVLENIVTYDPPISVTTVLLTQGGVAECGYDSTPPLRKLEGEVFHSEGSKKNLEIDIKSELMKFDPEEIHELITGEALLSVGGVIWSKSGVEEFKVQKTVKFEKI